ncbi:Cation/H(+) antiporter [Arachis hypogaea]|nr:Cation/H(+) antiporter [Arachis hypogaea]
MVTNATSASACPPPMKPTSNGVFQGDNPLDFALSMAILQICLVFVVTRGLAYIIRPLRQPRVIAEIVGGILLGPSALGRNKSYLNAVFPSKSLIVLDTLANIGLLFFLFLAGLELDPRSLRQTGKQTLAIAIAGINIPFALGIGSSFALKETIAKGVNGTAFLVFMGVALSITAFPVLARILAELKLLTTNVGRMAMSAAAVNDIAAWILLALAVALSSDSESPLVSLWVFLCGCGFVICSIIIVPPIFKRITQRCNEGEPVDEIYICATLVVVLAAGFVTDAIGIHAMFGAFVVGVMIPKDGPFTSALVEKVEDLVSGIFLPLFFVSSGLKTNVFTIHGLQSWGILALVIFTACFGKIVGTIVVSLFCKVPLKEALALGFLMNSKGLVELIVLNIGKDRKPQEESRSPVEFVCIQCTSENFLRGLSSTESSVYQTNDRNLIYGRHARRHLCNCWGERKLQRVLENAPCSVGILVDRGLGGTSHISASNVSYSITVLFFGGSDDREALAYGARMAEHPGIRLVVLRFVVKPSTTGDIVRVDVGESSFSTKLISEDEEFLNEFKAKVANDDFVTYEEKAVKDAAETVAVICEFTHCNLVLVGRRPQGELAYALKRNEYPELGPIGSLLVSQDCPTIASVLVMQQYQNQ